jgi:hypothetical protein
VLLVLAGFVLKWLASGLWNLVLDKLDRELENRGLMPSDWTGYSLYDGWLYSNANRCPHQTEKFGKDVTPAEAEQWLIDNNIRGWVMDEHGNDAIACRASRRQV